MESIGIYEGQVIVIGNATSNKGRRLSQQYVQLGARVILVDTHKHGLDKLISNIRFSYPDSIGSCIAMSADFDDSDDYARVVSLANTLFGEIDRSIDALESNISTSSDSSPFQRKPDSLTISKIAS